MKILNFFRNPRFIALAVTVVAVSWIASGVASRSGQPPVPEKPPAEITQAAATSLDVRVRTLSSERHVNLLRVSGRTQADRDLQLKSEVSGEVEELLVAEGDAIERGTPLLRLTAQDRPASLADALAKLAQARSDFQATERLFQEGFRSEAQLNAAKAALAGAEAQVERARLDVRRLVVDAPFASTVEEVPVEVGDIVTPGTVVARLLDLDPLRLAFSINEADLADVKLGAPVEAELSSGGVALGRGDVHLAGRRPEDAHLPRRGRGFQSGGAAPGGGDGGYLGAGLGAPPAQILAGAPRARR